MSYKPCNNTHNGCICLHGQTEKLLKRSLVLRLVRKILCGIVEENILIRFRVIVDCVNAVEDTAELVASLFENGVKTVAEPRVKNFTRIGIAYGCHLVGALNAALHKVNTAAEIKQGGVLLAKTEHIAENFSAVDALILNVMDCENCFDARVALSVCEKS